MKIQIKCDKCETVTTTTDRIAGTKALYNPCSECGSKQEVKWIEAPAKGGN